MEIKFYVYYNQRVIHQGTLKECISRFKSLETNEYKSLGVTINDSSIDLLIQNKDNKYISNDYKYSSLKNKLVTYNTIQILKREFSVWNYGFKSSSRLVYKADFNTKLKIKGR